MGGIAEATSKLRDKRIRRRGIDWIKLTYWPLWLALIFLTVVRAGGFKQVDFLYQTWHGISVSCLGSALLALIIVAIVVALTLIVGRRAFCHSLCWISPFMIIGTWIRERLRLPGLRLRAAPEKCVSCGACTSACPMSLDVQETMVAPNKMTKRECVLCATCVDACPTEAITIHFEAARPRRISEDRRNTRLQHRADGEDSRED